MGTLPQEFKERMKGFLGEEYQAFIESLFLIAYLKNVKL